MPNCWNMFKAIARTWDPLAEFGAAIETGSRLGSRVYIEFRWKRVSMQSDPPGR